MRTFIFVITIAIFFIGCSNSDEKQYALTVQETLDVINSKADILTAKEVADILLNENSSQSYQFIDIRTPHEFNVWHVQGALNMPGKNILSPEYNDILNNENITKVIYCKGSHQAMNIYTELIQLGYKNLKVSLGGYAFLKDHIIDSLTIENGIYNEDSALYDYAKVVKETSGGASVGSENKTPKARKKVVRRKKKSVEGGCG